MRYKYAVFFSDGYFEKFRPFVKYSEAKAYFDSLNDEPYEVILLEYLETKREGE